MKKTILIFLTLHILLIGQSQLPDEKVIVSEMNRFAAMRTYGINSVSSNNYDVNFYRCEFNVDPAIRYISGSVSTHFTITTSTNSIVFDLSNALTVDSVIFRGNKITFNPIPNDGLQITFPLTLNINQKDSVKIYYKGVPPNIGFGSFNMTTHAGIPVLWTLSEPYGARTWWPCKDALTDKADSIDIIIHNPVAYVSSSNGLPVSESVNGATRTTYWKHRYPIATYLVAFAVTNYVIDNDAVQLPGRTMPLVMYSYPESAAIFKTATSVAKIALENFSKLFSEYPFSKERYAQTQFGWGGGMEHQTNSFIVNAGTNLVAHELGHQWFGDKITTGSWHDLWLNEGFATYTEYLNTELTNPTGKRAHLLVWLNNITSLPDGSVYVPDTTNLSRLFNGRLTYRKGGYLVHMLRWKLGDSTFFRGVRRYLHDPALAYKHATTSDLKRNLEAESGQNLTEFFKDWFTGEGHPNYTAMWNQQSTSLLRLQLDQTQTHSSVSFFEMPVPVLFRSATRDTIFTLNHTTNGQIFNINPGFAVDTVIIDPDLWILSRNKIATKVSTSIGPNDLVVYPNPVSNQLQIILPNNTGGPFSVQLFNSLGQLLFQGETFNSSYNLPVYKYSPGLYYLRLKNNQLHHVEKVLIIKP